MNPASSAPQEIDEEIVVDDVKQKRNWREEPRNIGEEKMAKMGIECQTCGRPYDEEFFPKRIVQLSQRHGELECPKQPKVRTHHQNQDKVTAYQWEVIAKLEEKIEKLKRELEVKELKFETKTKTDRSEETEEEQKE